MNFVLMGSLPAANDNDAFATASLTPSTSNKMRPGFTTAAQNSRLPLPLPILTSSGGGGDRRGPGGGGRSGGPVFLF